jgi:hypothetical protein
LCILSNFLIPKNKPKTTPNITPMSIARPGGGGGCGGGGLPVCAKHTKLINTNKIEANILLYCTVILL